MKVRLIACLAASVFISNGIFAEEQKQEQPVQPVAVQQEQPVLAPQPVQSAQPAQAAQQFKLPEGFVYLSEDSPDIKTNIMYATSDNFMGRPIAGYEAPVCIMTEKAAEALRAIQDELKPFKLGLKVYDAYRPEKAIKAMVAWAKDPALRGSKSTYYPNIDKKKLLPDGYISDKSSHNRGSTVDLTLVSLDYWGNSYELDMGTPVDFFDPRSNYGDRRLTPEQQENRGLLRDVMIRHGFKPYNREWWHFELANEPFPNETFDFPVR